MYTKNKKYTKNKSSKKLRLLVLVVCSVLITALIFMLVTKDNESSKNQETTNTGSKINLDPPTDDELASGDAQKEKIVNEENKQELNNAEVVIVDASQYEDIVEVRAFVTNIVGDGKCTITFTKGSSSFTKETTAKADASTTTCVTMDAPLSDFDSSGTWDVEVKYIGNGATGSSKSAVEVIL